MNDTFRFVNRDTTKTMDDHQAQPRSSIGARKNPQTEEAILDAAATIIADKGIAGLRMEAVARAARAGKATLYRWWPSRGALLLAVYQKKKPQFTYHDTGSLEGDLKHFVTDLTAIWKAESGAFFRAILAEAQSDPDVAEMLSTYHSERRNALRELFARAEARGEIPADGTAASRAELLIGMMWLRLMTHRLDEPFEDAIALLCR